MTLGSVTVENTTVLHRVDFGPAHVQLDDTLQEAAVTLRRGGAVAVTSPPILRRQSSLAEVLIAGPAAEMAEKVKEMDVLIEKLASSVNALIRFFYPLNVPNSLFVSCV